jgi:flagellar biogenesis protein FliO
MAGGIIISIMGIILAIIIALFGILYYPIKRFILKRKNKK